MKQFHWDVILKMTSVSASEITSFRFPLNIFLKETLTSEFFAQCNKDPLYFLSFTIIAPTSWSMRSLRQPLLWCFIARWPGYAWPHGIKGSAPFSNNIFNIVSCESLIATWIGDSVYLVILSIPSFKSFPIITNWE